MVNAWTRWREHRAEARASRIESAAREDDAEDADAARLRILAVARLSDIPPGAALYLKTGEWRDADNPIGVHYRDVRVDLIHDRVMIVNGVTWVGVTGHKLECEWSDEEPHPPCLALVARVDAILRAVRA